MLPRGSDEREGKSAQQIQEYAEALKGELHTAFRSDSDHRACIV
jgi:hypothetical protein